MMKANTIIFGAVIGFGIGFAVSQIIIKAKIAKIKKEIRDQVNVRLYPDKEEDAVCEDTEINDDEIEEDMIREEAERISDENGYYAETEDEAIEREALELSEAFNNYIKKHPGEITIVSPDPTKRSDELNNVLSMLDPETLLYFPKENALVTEDGDRLEIEDSVGNCLYKFGFFRDENQTEIEVMNIPEQMHYYVKKEVENSVEELFPNI